jgi:hypothetical protein
VAAVGLLLYTLTGTVTISEPFIGSYLNVETEAWEPVASGESADLGAMTLYPGGRDNFAVKVENAAPHRIGAVVEIVDGAVAWGGVNCSLSTSGLEYTMETGNLIVMDVPAESESLLSLDVFAPYDIASSTDNSVVITISRTEPAASYDNTC